LLNVDEKSKHVRLGVVTVLKIEISEKTLNSENKCARLVYIK